MKSALIHHKAAIVILILASALWLAAFYAPPASGAPLKPEPPKPPILRIIGVTPDGCQIWLVQGVRYVSCPKPRIRHINIKTAVI